MNNLSWIVLALIGALAAASINVLGKIGMKEIDPTLATGVRSVVQAMFVLAVVTIMGLWSKIGTIHSKAMSMIVLCGIAGGISWICMFAAIAKADVSKVAPIDKLSLPIGIILAVLMLGERPSWINWMGIGLMVVGVYLATMTAKA